MKITPFLAAALLSLSAAATEPVNGHCGIGTSEVCDGTSPHKAGVSVGAWLSGYDSNLLCISGAPDQHGNMVQVPCDPLVRASQICAQHERQVVITTLEGCLETTSDGSVIPEQCHHMPEYAPKWENACRAIWTQQEGVRSAAKKAQAEFQKSQEAADLEFVQKIAGAKK